MLDPVGVTSLSRMASSGDPMTGIAARPFAYLVVAQFSPAPRRTMIARAP